jgi:hypothetical protein
MLAVQNSVPSGVWRPPYGDDWQGQIEIGKGIAYAKCMSGRKLWLLILAVVVVGFCAYRQVLPTSRLFDCVNSPSRKLRRPTVDTFAIVFERNCGATSPFLRVVSIHTKGEPFDGNDRKTWIFEIKDRPTANVRWSGGHKLIVSHSLPGKKLLERERFGDVQIVLPPAT